ncbi:uncharacterized protein [Rutidosis leptorrhynchoides]|uniref:uncharacterized protein n=1 Tax=Rutidosis leptorrhynchoides TaxID=125765 RepID=UPI003A99FD85
MPCKHAVASIWNLGDNSGDVGVPEHWVNPVYFLDTWRRTYAFTIKPINGRSMWQKPSATKLLPPKTVASAGRPKKSRRKGMDEKVSMNKGGKLSREGKRITCGTCGELGHNKRGCTSGSQNVGTKRKAGGSTSGTKKKKK